LRRPEIVAAAAQCACLLEVMSPKPGNVSRGRDLPDLTYQDLVLSAMAMGRSLRQAGVRRVGRLILGCIRETRRHVRTNTNLGMVLLLAPLARAAALGRRGTLRQRLRRVLRDLGVEDAREAYRAIRLAQPGGIGSAPDQDVRQSPTTSLLECMRLAAPRDAIAREYATDYGVTFDVALPALIRFRHGHLPLPLAVGQTSLTLLARYPDTLIVRRHGAQVARSVAREAARVLAAGGLATAAGRRRLERFDHWLRNARPPMNPGATADLIAAALFVWILESGPSAELPLRSRSGLRVGPDGMPGRAPKAPRSRRRGSSRGRK
jgi:triphosphoribosyl-dephospho-CoA synthase